MVKALGAADLVADLMRQRLAQRIKIGGGHYKVAPDLAHVDAESQLALANLGKYHLQALSDAHNVVGIVKTK